MTRRKKVRFAPSLPGSTGPTHQHFYGRWRRDAGLGRGMEYRTCLLGDCLHTETRRHTR